MADVVPFGVSLANLAASSAQPNFSLQFNQIQNTIIRRVNDEIARVNDSGGSDRHRVEKLKRDGLKLAEALPLIQAYRQGNSNNLGQIQQLIEDTTNLASALGSDDTVTQAEVDAFNAQRDVVVERVTNLYKFVHPDIVDGQSIQQLKAQIDALNALAPVVGSLSGDPENVTATETVASFLDLANTSLTVTQNTIATAVDFEENIQKKQVAILSEFDELTTVKQARKKQEIENIRIDYANLLTAISLTFEANANQVSELNQFLQPFQPAPGSILNIFS